MPLVSCSTEEYARKLDITNYVSAAFVTSIDDDSCNLRVGGHFTKQGGGANFWREISSKPQNANIW